MKYVLSFLFVMSLSTTDLILFDFSKTCDINNWYITNDDVMGGVSTSKITLNSNGHGVFQGKVSTENNGGFAMTKLPVSIDLNSMQKKIVLRVKGDSKNYQFRIKSKSYQRYSYVNSFQTQNEWETIELLLEDFYPAYRGYKLNKANFNWNRIEEIAILIGNKRDENFELEIDYIKII
ncbi:CIA30 family protein [Tenacibaculum sp. MEBiC06402]|uniref:CIA30 family protein n=1 Tax=unclassified Tenacibaculum TaxID=2635139 RepID=UPI003B9A421F